jgi:hypothetical protein
LPKLKGEFALGAKRTRPLSVAWTAFRLFPRAVLAFPGASAAQCRGWLRDDESFDGEAFEDGGRNEFRPYIDGDTH